MIAGTPVPLHAINAENAAQIALLAKLEAAAQSDVLALSPDGTLLATGLAKEAFYKELLGSDKIQIWNLSNGSSDQTLQLPGVLSSMAFEGETLRLAACTKGFWYGCQESDILTWQASDPAPAAKTHVKGLVYAFPPTAMPMVLHLSTTSFDNYQLWETGTEAPQKLYDIIQTTEWDAAMAYSPDGEHFVIGIGTSIKLYGTDSDQPTLLEDPNNKNKSRFTAFAFAPDGSYLASGDGAGRIKFWQLPDGTFLRALEGHTGTIEGMSFSADGSLLATISSDNTVRVWRTSDGMLLSTLTGACSGSGYKAARCAVAYSPTGTLIVSVGWPDKKIFLWGIP
jgi:WD40 repeat protein